MHCAGERAAPMGIIDQFDFNVGLTPNTSQNTCSYTNHDQVTTTTARYRLMMLSKQLDKLSLTHLLTIDIYKYTVQKYNS